MLLNPNQLQELLDIIDYHHTLFIFNHVGKEVLSSKDKEVLKSAGIDLEKNFTPTVNQAFKFGVLAEVLGNNNTKSLTFSDFKEYLKKGKFIPLTQSEEYSLEMVKIQKYKDIKGLGNRIFDDLNQIGIEVDKDLRLKREELIRQSVKETIENREGVKSLVSKLGEKLDDWKRDLGRVADYTLHEAYEEGRAASFSKKSGDEDPLVFKDVFSGSCKHCIRLYLTGGVGSEPIIFKLSELRANGSNIGRKPNDWLAVIGPTHPYCRCTMQYYDKRYSWNPKDKDFSTLKLITPKIERKSKVVIEIGNKKFEV